MTALGGLVKDAWIFGLLPESQTCEVWTHAAMEALGRRYNVSGRSMVIG